MLEYYWYEKTGQSVRTLTTTTLETERDDGGTSS